MTAASLEEDEQRSLDFWAFDRFLELGYSRHLAETLVFAHVDWHDAKRLLEDGCPPETALEILT